MESASVVFPVRFFQKGKDGATGAAGPWLRPCGTWYSGMVVKATDDFQDYVYYTSSADIRPYVYILIKGSYSGSSYTSTITPDQDTSHWAKANQIKLVATDALIAGSGQIDVLGTGRILIGYYDGDTPVGWIGQANEIYHSISGLRLTSKGEIIDPDGLHLRVGSQSVVKTANLLSWGGFSSAVLGGTGFSLVSSYNSYSPYGANLLMYYTASAVSNLTTSCNKRTRLGAGKTYVFSLWGINIAGSGSQTFNIGIRCYSAESGGSYVTAASESFSLTYHAYNGIEQLSVEFTVPAGYTWFGPDLYFSSIVAGRRLLFFGAMLSLGSSVPGAYELPSVYNDVSEALLAAGIDIDDKKIRLFADQLECLNLRGKKTAWLDDVGVITVAGVVNSMIAEIDPVNLVNDHLLIDQPIGPDDGGDDYLQSIPWTITDDSQYSLDVLRCPDVIILSNIDKNIVLPHYWFQNYYARTMTKYSSGSEHPITAEELVAMVGRKLTIKINASSGQYYLYGGPVVEGVLSSVAPTELLQGNIPIKYPYSNSSMIQLNVSGVLSLEFKCGQCDNGNGTYSTIYYWAINNDGGHNLPDWS